MSSRADILLCLLHTTTEAVLAGDSIATPSPVETRLPFAPDQRHCPIFLESRSSGSIHRLLDDPVSLILADPVVGTDNGHAIVNGRFEPMVADKFLAARYLRYQPEGLSVLRSGDFEFFRFMPMRIRISDCRAQSGWLETGHFLALPALSLADEAAWIVHNQAEIPDWIALLGIDSHGIDMICDGRRKRELFRQGPVTAEAIGPSLARMFTRLKRDKAIADSNMTPVGLLARSATSFPPHHARA